MVDTTEIRKLLRDGKLVIGSELVLKGLKKKEISRVFLCSNYPKDKLAELETLKGVSDFEMETLNITNEQLGVLCKKPFSIAIIGVTA